MSLRVLVVEDEPLIAMSLGDMVADIGHTCIAVARTVGEAMARIETDQPDIVLLDVDLGGQPGYDIAHHCTLKGVPVVFTTGYSTGDVPAALAHCPVLSKPYSSRELEEAIRLATS